MVFESRPRSLETRVLSVPLDPVIITANYTIQTVELLVLRVRDGDEAEGYGCLWCFGAAQARVLLAMIDYLAAFVIQPHRDIHAVRTEIRREINFFGFKGVSVFGLAAVDMALWDLVCRRKGVSLATLMGRRHDTLPIYWSGLFVNQTTPELVEEAHRAVAAGYGGVKLRVGKPWLSEDVERIEAILAAVSPGTALMLDAIQAWTPDEAIVAARAFAPYAPLWLEDPVVHDDYSGLQRIVEESEIPIAAGENEYLRGGFTQLLDAGAHYLLVDLQRVGGISEWFTVAGDAADRGRIVTPHLYPHVTIQLCASLEQPEQWVEHLGWWDELMTYRLVMEGGRVRVPEVAGIGLDFDAAALNAFAVGPWVTAGVDG